MNILIRENTEKKVFCDFFGKKLIPPYLVTPVTEKGLGFIRRLGDTEAELGEELPLSRRGLINYRWYNTKDFRKLNLFGIYSDPIIKIEI